MTKRRSSHHLQVIIASLLTILILAITMQSGWAQTITNAQIVAAAEAVGMNQSLAQAVANASSNVEDTTGQLDIMNSGGSSAAGLMQMVNANTEAYGNISSTQYAQSDIQTQMEIYGKYLSVGFQSTAIQTMNGMTTFDGQPVDDALKIACVQTGTGTCEAMLTGGKCSDGTAYGQNICAYATKIRAGAVEIGTTGQDTNITGDTTNSNPLSVIQSAAGGSTGGTTMAMGNPIHCWSCDIIEDTMEMTEAVSTTGMTTLLTLIVPLLIVMAIIGISYKLLIALIAGVNPVRYVGPTIIRAFFIIIFLTAGASTFQNTIFNDLMIPAVEGGSAIGQTLADSLSQSLNMPIDNINVVQGKPTTTLNDDCKFGTNPVTLTYLQGTENAALSLACTMHHSLGVEIQIGMLIASSKAGAGTKSQKAAQTVLDLSGLFIAGLGVLGLIKFALVYLDILTNLAITMVFAPWAAYAYIFDATRASTTSFLKRFMQVFVALITVGLSSVFALYVIIASMQAGLGVSSSTTPDQILISAQNLINDINLNQPTSVASIIQFMLYTVVGTMIAGHIIPASTKFADMVTGTVTNQALSRALTGAIMTTARIALASVGGVATILGGAGATAAAQISTDSE